MAPGAVACGGSCVNCWGRSLHLRAAEAGSSGLSLTSRPFSLAAQRPRPWGRLSCTFGRARVGIEHSNYLEYLKIKLFTRPS